MAHEDEGGTPRKGKLSAFTLLTSWLFNKRAQPTTSAETEFLNTRDGYELAKFAQKAFGGDAEAIEDPLDITTGLWFIGSLTVWNGLNDVQRALADPDFAAQAELGKRYSVLDIQALQQRRGLLGSQLRQFMEQDRKSVV